MPDKVFIILESYDNDHFESEIKGAYATLASARETLKERIKEAYTCPPLDDYDPDDENDDWEITQTEDEFYAQSDSRCHWIHIEIIEERVQPWKIG